MQIVTISVNLVGGNPTLELRSPPRSVSITSPRCSAVLRRAKPDAESRQPLWILRSEDQAILGGVALLALIALALLWFARGGWSGELVEYEDLPRRTVRFQVDINAAEWPELAQLPRIGPALARRIVEYRQTHGPFQEPEDLLEVRGIGPKTLEAIRPHLAPMGEAGS